MRKFRLMPTVGKVLIFGAVMSVQLIQAADDINYPMAADEQGRTAIHRAALSGDKQTINKFVNADADIDFQDKQDKTALYLAVEANKPDMVSFLLSLRADAWIANMEGELPISLAKKMKYTAIYKMLDEHMKKYPKHKK